MFLGNFVIGYFLDKKDDDNKMDFCMLELEIDFSIVTKFDSFGFVFVSRNYSS